MGSRLWTMPILVALSVGLAACGDDPEPIVLTEADGSPGGASTRADVPTTVDVDLASGLECEPMVLPNGDYLMPIVDTLGYSDLSVGYPTPTEALAASLNETYPGMADAAMLVGQDATKARFDLPAGKGAFLVTEVHWKSGAPTWLLTNEAICDEARAQFSSA